MQRSPDQLRTDALAIWQAAVDAVCAERLVADNVRVADGALSMGDERLPLATIRRIVVIGAGKAGAGMAAGLEAALGETVLREKQVSGWINVPEDCVRSLGHITLHGARPAGVNEPTAAGVVGAERILELVASLGPQDLCLCVLSGGGSALLPAPVAGVTLADKLAITRQLSGAGANIQQLNAVRKQLSRIKGGGLARACRASRLVTLIISDVIGDPLDVIASGPTVDDTSTPQAALDVLRQFGAREAGIAPAAFEFLERAARASQDRSLDKSRRFTCHVTNLVIGNNALAVDGAGMEAVRRGYSPALWAACELEGPAEDVGRHLADMAYKMRGDRESRGAPLAAGPHVSPDCLITGGEPIVKLAPAHERGLGGRNQQLVLAALEQLLPAGGAARDNPLDQIVILSGGTDGEDGPTDAAGAIIDAGTCAAMRARRLDPAGFLARNDAYHFFEPLGGLIKTGPTHTNVCDVRVVVVGPR